MIVKVNRTVSDDEKLFFCLSSSFWTFVWARLKKSKFLFVCFLWVIFSFFFFLLFISDDDDLVFEKLKWKIFLDTKQTSFGKVKRMKKLESFEIEMNKILSWIFFYEIGKSLEDFHPVWWRWWCGYILNLKKYFHLNFRTTKNERMKNPGEKTR